MEKYISKLQISTWLQHYTHLTSRLMVFTKQKTQRLLNFILKIRPNLKKQLMISGTEGSKLSHIPSSLQEKSFWTQLNSKLMKRMLRNSLREHISTIFRGRKITFKSKSTQVFDMENEEEAERYFYWIKIYGGINGIIYDDTPIGEVKGE